MAPITPSRENLCPMPAQSKTTMNHFHEYAADQRPEPDITPPYAPETQRPNLEKPVTDRGQFRDESTLSRKSKPKDYDAYRFYPVNTAEMARTQRERLAESVSKSNSFDYLSEHEVLFDSTIWPQNTVMIGEQCACLPRLPPASPASKVALLAVLIGLVIFMCIVGREEKPRGKAAATKKKSSQKQGFITITVDQPEPGNITAPATAAHDEPPQIIRRLLT